MQKRSSASLSGNISPLEPRPGRDPAAAGPAAEPAPTSRPPAGVRRRPAAWVCWLAVGASAVCGYFALPPGPAADAVYTLVGLGCVASLVYGVRLHRPDTGTWWYLLATGQLLWVCGDVTYSVYEDVLRVTPFPSPADAFYMGAYPLLGASLHLLTRRRSPGRDRAGLLDGALAATGLGLLSWVFLMRPAAEGRADGVCLLGQALSLAYPVGDLVVLAMVLRVIAVQRARTASCWLLAASLLLLVLSDAAFAALTAMAHGYVRLLDAGWLASYLLMGAAALHPSMAALPDAATGRSAQLTRRRLALLAAATLLAPGVLFAQGMSGAARIDWLAVSVSSAVLFLLVVVRVSDLTAQVQGQADRLAELAGSDGLTGIPNRRTWDFEVARQLAEADRTGASVCVALLDLDRFKRFNDTHGHLAGDHLLKSAAASWQRQLRAGDLLARYGGEEFGVLVVGLTAERAAAVVDRLRRHTPLGQTLSAGVARWDGVESAHTLLGRADRALYRAKSTGRDRVVVAAEAVWRPGGSQNATSEQE